MSSTWHVAYEKVTMMLHPKYFKTEITEKEDFEVDLIFRSNLFWLANVLPNKIIIPGNKVVGEVCLIHDKDKFAHNKLT